MKKLFTLMLLAVSASAMLAQSNPKIIKSERSIYATLSEFSPNGKVQMYFRNDDGNTS